MKLVPREETALTSYYGNRMLKDPVWIWTVPAYFYAGGVAGAALVLGAAAQIGDQTNLRSLITKSRWIGVAGIAAGTVFLIVDLGRPERFLHMLRVFNVRSPLSIGSWILTAAGMTAGASVVLPGEAANSAGIGAGLLGIPLAGYTGVLLCNSAIPVWQGTRHTLPALFVASAVASCASLFEMMSLSKREEKVVHAFGAIGKAAELVCMNAVEAELSANSQIDTLRTGVSGALWTTSKVLTVASLALTLMPGQSRKTRVAGLLGTLAGIGLRFAIFQAGKKPVGTRF